ncbi:MAG: UDP-N-acetylmuramoyl-tripeptide--D-alanyl-D-alanine ligase [bacterium]
MSWLLASDVACRLDAELTGNDVAVESVSTDTRKPDPQALFFALQGPNFDAHYALDALPPEAPKVAAALVVSRPVDYPAPQIIVDDTRLALGRLAKSWRSDFRGTLVAITGSNGKTTVKEMLSKILATQGEVLATKGNLNNDIGMPLTLLRLREHHQYAVIEMGANHAGEIDYLSHIARPDIALVNNAGPAHLEGFGSIEGVARAKAEIYSGLRDNGIAVINSDDPFSTVWKEASGTHQTLSFGMANDKSSPDAAIGSLDPLTLRTAQGSISPYLSLMGAHNAMNAAAASACALAAGVELQDIQQGLESMEAVAGRLESKKGVGGSRIIDDSYNANPASIRAAIDTLAQQRGVTVLVLGDMAEVGEDAEVVHAEIGRYAKKAHIDGFMATGSLMFSAVKAFGPGASHYDDHESLAQALLPVLSVNSVVLVKGSRSMQMERVVALLSADDQPLRGGVNAS